jgi:hypothetical protein
MQFMLRELQKAVDPCPGLSWCMEHWSRIAAGLKDSPRRRQSQRQRLENTIDRYDDAFR